MSDINKERICLVYQPLGIGDVFFCQGIGNHYLNLGPTTHITSDLRLPFVVGATR